jgi:hypothetical protein
MKKAFFLITVVGAGLFLQSSLPAEELSGIGVKLSEKNGQIVLELVYPGAPADQAGLQSGNAILAIDGKSVRGKKLQDVQKNLTGPADTKVKLLLKDSEGNTRTVEVTRKSFRVSAEGPDEFVGDFVATDKPDMKIVVKKASEYKWQIFCENENWSGAGVIYQNPTFKTFHYKGVFRMDDSPKVEEAMRGVGGFFRINYMANGALELKRQWGLEGDKGDKSTTVMLIRSDNKSPSK